MCMCGDGGGITIEISDGLARNMFIPKPEIRNTQTVSKWRK